MTPPLAKKKARAGSDAAKKSLALSADDGAEGEASPEKAEARSRRAAARVTRRAAKSGGLDLSEGAEAANDPQAPAEAEAEDDDAGKDLSRAVKTAARVSAKSAARAIKASGAPKTEVRAARKSAKAAVVEGDAAKGAEPEEDADEDGDPPALTFTSVRRDPARDPELSGPDETVTAAAPGMAMPQEQADAATAAAPAVRPATVPYEPAFGPDWDDEDEDDDDSGRGARRKGRRSRKSGKETDAAHYVVAPMVGAAQMRPRHYGVLAMFCLFVILPTISYSWYLWTRAADQYESDLGFGSRTEQTSGTFEFLGALTGSGQSGSKDMDILNQFVVSQELVAKIDAELDLKAIWSKPSGDPLAAFQPDGTIEDLLTYWQRMVRVDYDNLTGLMNLRIFAFDPKDSQAIAFALLRESTDIINQLSQTAQDDTTRYSKAMLAETEKKLADARLAVLDFQVRNNIVDPSNVVASQLSVISSLNQELANAQVELDLLTGTVPASDPRMASLQRKLEVIQNRIAAERAKVGASAGPDQPGYAELMGDFERLKVALDFAQRAYLSALAAHDQALADAQKKTRYLATYVAPTLAEAPTAPNRPGLAALTALIGFLVWSVVVLTYYALRDRR